MTPSNKHIFSLAIAAACCQVALAQPAAPASGAMPTAQAPAPAAKPGDDPELRTEKFEHAATNLTIPILLIRGKLSDVVSPEGVQHFLATVPQAEFVELSNAGHTAAGDDNDAFSEAVVTFVRRGPLS